MTTTLQIFPPSFASRMSGFPGYIAGRFYAPYAGVSTNATAVGTVDTVVYLTPFTASDVPMVATSLNVRVVTGAASSAVKMAVWATGAATSRPTGVPLIGSNTGQSTVTSSTTPTIAVSYTFLPGVCYWFGAAFTTLAPTMVSISSGGLGIQALVGQSGPSANPRTGLSAPYTYATDIMALDLTAATFTDLQPSVGNPVFWVGV